MATILHMQDFYMCKHVVRNILLELVYMKDKCEHLTQCAFICALQTANQTLSNTINLQNCILATRLGSAPLTRRIAYRRGRDKIDFSIHLN